MVKHNYFVVFVFAVMALSACNKPVKGRNGVVYKSAVQYNDYIVNRQTTLMKNVVAFGEMVQKAWILQALCFHLSKSKQAK